MSNTTDVEEKIYLRKKEEDLRKKEEDLRKEKAKKEDYLISSKSIMQDNLGSYTSPRIITIHYFYLISFFLIFRLYK